MFIFYGKSPPKQHFSNSTIQRPPHTQSTMFLGTAKRIMTSRCIHKSLILLSVAGFMWQVFIVSIEYFGYKTTTAVTFNLLPYVKNQVTVLCVRYRDIMDRQRIRKERGIRFEASSGQTQEMRVNDEEQLTIEQIYNYTPAVEHVIDRCTVPDEEGSRIEEVAEECGKYFTIKKYFKQEHICYQFFRHAAVKHSIEQITHSMRNSFLVYEILMSGDFNDVTMLEAIVFNDPNGYPFLSRDYGIKHVVQVSNRNKTDHPNYVSLSAYNIIIKRLAKPYDTQCVNVDEKTTYKCTLECILDTYESVNRGSGIRDSASSLPDESHH